MQLTVLTSESYEHAVGGTSAAFGTMAADTLYTFVSSTACWIAQGDTPTASAGAGSMYVPANVTVVLNGSDGAECAVIQDTAAGKASLTRMRRF